MFSCLGPLWRFDELLDSYTLFGGFLVQICYNSTGSKKVYINDPLMFLKLGQHQNLFFDDTFNIPKNLEKHHPMEKIQRKKESCMHEYAYYSFIYNGKKIIGNNLNVQHK